MGSKRSGSEVGLNLMSVGNQKRVKEDNHEINTNSSRLLVSDCAPRNIIDEALPRLQKLAGELTNNAQSIRSCLGKAGSDIVNKARQLQVAILQATKPEAAACSSISHNVFSNAVGLSKGSTLPRLPSVVDPSLERAVFTHPGVVQNCSEECSNEISYDRLELLGDAYIETIATRLIWDNFAGLSAGRMSQVREDLVKNETLAHFATLYSFDKKVSVPREHRTQAKRWMKTKADVFEAYVAAIILSNPVNGYMTAERWLAELWVPKLSQVEQIRSTLKAKELLAKKIMSKGVRLKYVDEQPPVQVKSGMQKFSIGVYFTGWGWDNQHLGSGFGLNKTIAGDEAARQALLNKPLIDQIAASKYSHDVGIQPVGINSGDT